MPEPAEPYLVVGLGASAGGISVLKEFFRHVPATTGNAYVVILHLSPEHESLLSQILQTVAVDTQVESLILGSIRPCVEHPGVLTH